MIRILLIDEQKVIREGLRFLLESKSNVKIVAAVSNSYAAISKIEQTNPNILFIGIKLSEIEGLDIIAIIRKKYPQIKVIIFSNQANEQHLFQLLEMGIKGYLLKNTPVEEIIEAIHAVDKGYTHISNAAYDNVIPQISQTISEQNLPQPEAVFGDISNYQALPQWEQHESSKSKKILGKGSKNSPKAQKSSEKAVSKTSSITSQSQNNHQEEAKKNSQTRFKPNSILPKRFPLIKANSVKKETSVFSSISEPESKKNQGINRYFPIVTLASLSLLGVSAGLISLIGRSSPQLVIENAVVNGKTIELDSPVKGTITAVNYPQGASITPESIIATIEPDQSELSVEANKIQEQIELKQQQYTVSQQSLAFLENSFQNVQTEAANSTPEQLDTLIKSIYLNQIKHQEIAFKTAKIREDIAKSSYENLKQLQSAQISAEQLKLAQNSWKLAQMATEEIAVNLEIIRQEYELIKRQIAESKPEISNRGSQKASRLAKQIQEQKAVSELLQQEIANLEQALNTASIATPAKLVETSQAIAIKSPIAGAIYNQQYSKGQVVEVAETITTIVDCNNLWVEATVDPQVRQRVNLQDSVLVTITDSDLSLQGKISQIESINNSQILTRKAEAAAIKTQVPLRLDQGNYSKIVVEVPFSIDQLSQQQFCSVGKTARLSFREDKDSLVSYYQPKLFFNLIMSKFKL